MKIYGIDRWSIKKNPDLLLSPRGPSKVSKRTEDERNRNCIEKVYFVLNDLAPEEALNYLKKLES